MAAVMTTPRIDIEPAVTRTVRRVEPRSVARRGHRALGRHLLAPARGRRRGGPGGAGHGGEGGVPRSGLTPRSPRAPPGRLAVRRAAGDSLWSIAAKLEPGRDPAPSSTSSPPPAAAPLVPGEVVTSR